MTTPTLVTDITGATVPLEADWGAQASLAAEKHLAACWEWHHQFEDSDEEPEDDNPAVGMFCGGSNCVHTCEVHETLAAAMPFIEAGLAREFRAAIEDGVARQVAAAEA